MAKENVNLKQWKELGLVDDRGIAVVADISCTNGNGGRAFVFINGTTMYIHELQGFSNVGQRVETLDLTKAKFVKSCSFILASSLILVYGLHRYKFENFGIAKQFIGAAREACGA